MLNQPRGSFPDTETLSKQRIGRGEKAPTPKISALLRKRPVLLRANFVLTKDRNGLTTDIFVVKYTGRGLVVKRPGVLSKVQILNLVLGVGVFSLLPRGGGRRISDSGRIIGFKVAIEAQSILQ